MSSRDSRIKLRRELIEPGCGQAEANRWSETPITIQAKCESTEPREGQVIVSKVIRIFSDTRNAGGSTTQEIPSRLSNSMFARQLSVLSFHMEIFRVSLQDFHERWRSPKCSDGMSEIGRTVHGKHEKHLSCDEKFPLIIDSGSSFARAKPALGAAGLPNAESWGRTELRYERWE